MEGSNSPRSARLTEPRIGTLRNPARKTFGKKWGQVSAALGEPFMPWQQYAADVAGEVDDEGKLWYREVNLLVPRQSGKTTLIRAKSVHRCLAYDRPQRVAYTAQSRIMARRKWENDFVRSLDRSPLAGMYRVSKAPGTEAVRWANGSWFGIDAVTKKAGHGETLDDGTIDEAFAQIDSRVEQAMRPAMITRTGSQLWVVSTAGDATSSYLKGKVDTGRARIEAGQDSRICYLEWSIPDDADLTDPANWWRYMPALGHTMGEDDIQAELEGMDLDDFARAYGNQWRTGQAPDLIIPLDAWQARSIEPGHAAFDANQPPIWAVDTSVDREFSSIAYAATATVGEERRRYVEIVDQAPGALWVGDRMHQLRERHGGSVVAISGSGSAASLQQELLDDDFDVMLLPQRQVAQACNAFYDDALKTEGGLAHLNDPVLNVALASAVKRYYSDTWVWGRGKSLADITALYAATLARWALVERGETYYDQLASTG